MNFLAHLYLSGNSEEIMLGNFIGDFVKGNKFENYSPQVKEGILLHRRIDYFTDRHPVVAQSKELLWDNYRHYSGVIVDMFYDHFLASEWEDYSDQTLPEFSSHVYEIMLSRKDAMPRSAAHMLTYMAQSDWLLSYSTTEGINRALSGMAKRTTFTSHMENAVNDLETNYDLFHSQFKTFFPDLINEVSGQNPYFGAGVRP